MAPGPDTLILFAKPTPSSSWPRGPEIVVTVNGMSCTLHMSLVSFDCWAQNATAERRLQQFALEAVPAPPLTQHASVAMESSPRFSWISIDQTDLMTRKSKDKKSTVLARMPEAQCRQWGKNFTPHGSTPTRTPWWSEGGRHSRLFWTTTRSTDNTIWKAPSKIQSVADANQTYIRSS